MIKRLRETKGLTQSELAKKIGLSKSHVSRMERRVKTYRASYSTIKLLAKHLDECPIKIFIFFADIGCEHIKEVNKSIKLIKCEFKNCKMCESENFIYLKTMKEVRRLRLENARIKKQLKSQRRAKRMYQLPIGIGILELLINHVVNADFISFTIAIMMI